MTIELRRVEFMPKTLEPNVLYVSERYCTAAHLCVCGCGEKIRTPLGPTEWSVHQGVRGPTLWPSVGSWQRPCRSHYLITNGVVSWASQWSEADVQAGRQREQLNREIYFNTKTSQRQRFSLWGWFKALFRN